MRRKRLHQVAGYLLSGIMLLSLTACSNNSNTNTESTSAGSTNTEQSSTETSAGDKPLTKITVYPANATTPSGLVGGYKGDIFADRGIAVEIWAYSDEKTNAILASGDLPDVMVVPNDKLDTMIEAGMLLNLDNYLTQMPNVSESEEILTALNYVRKYRSAGTGSVYCLPTEVGSTVRGLDTERNALRLNWEVYEAIGAPEIKDVWDLIPVMKQMLEERPTNSEGETCYGTFLNNGSDTTYWGCMQMYYKWFGFEPTNLPYLIETDMVNAEFKSILEKDSLYYEGLKWYNMVYREGLMDPDSINTDRVTQKTKVEGANLAMVPSGTVPGWAPIYRQYYLPDTNLYVEHWDQPYGSGSYSLAIKAKTENLDAALAFLDSLSDKDVLFKVKCGPEGDAWHLEGDQAVISPEALEASVNGTTYELANGEKLENWGMTFVIGANLLSDYKDGNGNFRKAMFSAWAEVVEEQNNNELYKKWQDTTGGYDDFTSLLEANNAYYLNSDLDYLESFTINPDDTMQLTIDAIKDVVVNASWKMVYAESDEQFQMIWDTMVADCEGLGGQEVIDWRLQELETAKTVRDSMEVE